MRLKLERAAGYGIFSRCCFRTPFYEKEIAGLSLAGPKENLRDKLVLYTGDFWNCEESMEKWMDQIKERGAVGLLADGAEAEESVMDALCRACSKRELVFGILETQYFVPLIYEYSQLIESRTDGQIKTWEKVMEELRCRFYARGLNALLEGIYYWTSCQVVLIAGQDTFVRPASPMLNEEIFYPAYWLKESFGVSMSHVNLYSSSCSDKTLLKAELYKNCLPSGTLCLIGKKGQFERSDALILDYGAVLCSGLDDYKGHSVQIEAAIDLLCQGKQLDAAQRRLFPDAGYALVLKELEQGAGEKEKTEYLSYLLHHYFPQKLCYSFSSDGGLRLFVAADDIEHFGRRLLAILDRTGKRCRMGVSRSYDISQAVRAFAEAESAAYVSGLLEYEERIFYYQDLGIYRLLNYPENSWPVNQMLGEMDELLNKIDREKRDILALTVRTFVKCRFNYQKTADKLYTHVNTIRYRIKLIEDLWEVDLSSDDGRLLFSVLAKLLPLWMKSGCYKGTMPEEE